LLHLPCVGLPLAVSGLPLGVTLTGPRFSDQRVLRAAAVVAGVLCSPSATDPHRN
jgi:Asp-tRNA(Asn)/Glu-tRNA(Gln) amidotransferase A subunit family amidase